jgi:integrase
LAAAYEDLRRAGPERAERVRRLVDGYLVPWFAPRTTTIADITYFMAHDWLLYLVGRDSAAGNPSARRPAAGPDPAGGEDGEMSLAEAAKRCGVSVPTMRRRWQDGQLPGAYRDHNGYIRVPPRALRTVKGSKHARPAGLSQRYVADALWILRRIMSFARANGLFPAGFDPTEGLEAPLPDPAAARTRKPTAQPRPLSLPECGRIASHLHAVHQMVFWLQRIMGLRVSETYGILIRDFIDLGDTAMLAIQGQGGRNFNIRDDHGTIVTVARKDTLKTAAGSRVLVAPTAITALVRVAIQAFHTDPDTGQVDPDARLIPGIHQANRAGLMSYAEALEDAANTEGLGSDDLGFRVSTHLLRKSLATDLAWQSGIEDTVRRRFMGHRAGEDVFGRVYTLDDPELAPLAKVAAVLDDHIANSITTLLTPTTQRVQWGTGNPIHRRAGHVADILTAAGWLVDPGDTDDPLWDAKRVAVELDINQTTARRWMRDGTIPSVAVADSHGVPRRWARQSAVLAHRDHLTGRVGLPELAVRLGVPYDELARSVRRLGLTLDQHPTGREFEVSDHNAEILRVEHDRIRALHERSMNLPAAARKLNLVYGTVSRLADGGNLQVDPETDSSGSRFVTRTSVQACWIARNRTKYRKVWPEPAVPVAEVARFTGRSRPELIALIRSGALRQLPGQRAVQLTLTSLQTWLTSIRKEETDRI